RAGNSSNNWPITRGLYNSTNKRSKGTKIHAWACNGKNVNQKWYLKKRPGGHFEIKSANSGLCLDVAGGSKNKGAQVLQWPCHGKANQQWIFIASAEKGWFRIRAKHSKKCLALTKANTKNGTPFRQWDCWKTKDQMFKWVK
ncbi:MAG: RICIN domain-containing protein, partial [Rhodospirillaceae bacterium]